MISKSKRRKPVKGHRREFRCKMFLYLLFFVEKFLVMFGCTWQLCGTEKNGLVQLSSTVGQEVVITLKTGNLATEP